MTKLTSKAITKALQDGKTAHIIGSSSENFTRRSPYYTLKSRSITFNISYVADRTEPRFNMETKAMDLTELVPYRVQSCITNVSKDGTVKTMDGKPMFFANLEEVYGWVQQINKSGFDKKDHAPVTFQNWQLQ